MTCLLTPLLGPDTRSHPLPHTHNYTPCSHLNRLFYHSWACQCNKLFSQTHTSFLTLRLVYPSVHKELSMYIRELMMTYVAAAQQLGGQPPAAAAVRGGGAADEAALEAALDEVADRSGLPVLPQTEEEGGFAAWVVSATHGWLTTTRCIWHLHCVRTCASVEFRVSLSLVSCVMCKRWVAGQKSAGQISGCMVCCGLF